MVYLSILLFGGSKREGGTAGDVPWYVVESGVGEVKRCRYERVLGSVFYGALCLL